MPKDKKTRTRANNGMGSIRQRPDKRWEARYTTPDGRQHSLYGKSEKDVTAKLRTALHDLDSGVWHEPSKMTTGTWLDIWLTDYQAHMSSRTVAKYRCISDKHFQPEIGIIRITSLLPVHIRRLVTTMRENGLAASTVCNYMTVLRAALSCAVEAGLIQKNPAANIKLPRPQKEMFTVIDRNDIQAFIEAAKNTKYPNELLLMLYTGLRIGEIRGLRWCDVDLDEGTIDVQRQLHPHNGTLTRISPPKYGETRLLHIPVEAVEVLRDQRRRQAEQHIANADTWIDTDISRDLVFREPDGSEHSEKTIYYTVKKVGAAIGKPDLHPHDLRHSYAIAALRSGADVKTVQYNLGHKTAKMTLDVYAAYTEDAGKVSAKKLSKYLKDTEK